MTKVLVTGGTGFLASWTVRKLLERNYEVVTTVRESKKTKVVTDMLNKEGIATDKLSFAFADLTKSDGWIEAMDGVDYVLHLASPLGGNNHENPELIQIAKKGVEVVLDVAVKAGVKRVVMTSSQGTCYPLKSNTSPNINEEFWTDLENKHITNYMRSKVIAEKTAWDIINEQSNTTLTTILPGAILGPYMAKKRSSTDQIFEMLLKGTPSPKVIYPVVDVRDLAELHILAIENSAAVGQRFIAHSEEMPMPNMARLLKREYPNKKISTFTIPDFVISIMSKFQPPMKVLNTMIGLKYHYDTSKARKMLGWNPRTATETVIDTAKYLTDNNLI